MYYSPKQLYFGGTDGNQHVIRPCSIIDRKELSTQLNILFDELLQSDQEESFFSLYNGNFYLKSITDGILRLCKVDPNVLTPDLLFALLFPHTDEESIDHTLGLLAEVNGFTPDESGLSSEEEATEAYYRLLAIVWQINGGISDALEACKNVPADVMMGMIDERMEMLRDPEERKKEKAQASAKAKLEELREQGVSMMDMISKGSKEENGTLPE